MPTYELTSCLACGSAASEEIADAAAVREEVEALWAFHQRRLRGDTPPERLADRVAFSQDPPLRLARCTACGLVYRNPIERAESLDATYADEAPPQGVFQALHDTQREAYRAQATRLASIVGRAGSGIEVGSYVAGFLAAARELGWRFEGVDVNADAVAFARTMGFAAHEGALESLPDAVRVDVVAFWNCFDQLPDPGSALRAARAHLNDGGWIAIRVPNGGFYARLRRMLHGPFAPAARLLLAHNNLLAFPYRYGFTPESLQRMVERSGFAVQRVLGDTLVPIADLWTKGWAAREERLVKQLLAITAHTPALAPWFELYARIAD